MKSRITAFFIVIASLAAASSVCAGAYLYAGQRKHINCGVLAVTDRDNTALPANVSALAEVGNLFYLLDQRADLKPAGWSLENPLAPGSPSTGLGKNQVDYWVIDLAAVRSLSRMHVLYLPASGQLDLDDDDREKLRRFVDGGGVLWIDNVTSGAPLDFRNSFFIRDFKFYSASGIDSPVNRHHPVLTSPHWLDTPEIAALGASPGQFDCDPGYQAGQTWGDMADEPVCFDVLLPVVVNVNTGRPSVAANVYGSGRVIATSNYVGKSCFFGYPFEMPSLKFAYNVIAWSSSGMTLRKDARHTGAAIDTVGGSRLVEQWCLQGVTPLEGSVDLPAETSPVIYKNVVFYTGMLNGASVLFAVDLMSTNDLDHDGIFDDGFPDGSSSSPFTDPPPGVDLLWAFPAEGGADLSSPTVVSVQNPKNPSETIEAVLVTSSSGDVYMVQAFPNTGGKLDPNLVPPVIITRKLPGTSTIEKPMPPLLINGWIYAINGDGRLCAYNPSLAAWAAERNVTVNDHWEVPSVMDVNFTGVKAKTGPSFGFVRNDGSGALVGMVYWVGSNQSVSKPTEQNDHVYGVPVYCGNDRLRIRQTSSDRRVTECQIAYREGTVSPAPKPVVWVKTSSGTITVPDSDIVLNRGLVGGIVNTVDVKPGALTITNLEIPPDAIIFATYALDYSGTGGVQVVQPRIRVPLEPRSNPANQVPETAISSTGAMAPDNMIFLAGTRSQSTVGGSVFGLYNDGSTQSTRWHYFMHSGADVPTGMNTGATWIPGTIVQYKDEMGVPLPDPVPMTNPQSTSSPVYAGDKVFVTVSGDGNPAGALLCFKSDPDFVIRVTENAGFGATGTMNRRPKRLYSTTNDRRQSVKIWQPNVMMPNGPGITVAPLMAAIPVPSEMIDYDRGTITFTSFDRLKLRGAGTNFMQTNTFSSSLPVWVFLDNVEVPVDFSTWGPSVQWTKATGGAIPPVTGEAVDLSSWNNLLWYYIVPPYVMPDGSSVPCTGVHSSPIVVGNTVYFVTDDGVLIALNSETGETMAGPVDTKNLIWQHKAGAGLRPGTNVSPVGANGVLLVPAGDGLHAFANSATLVADSNRVLELNGAGEVAWSIDSVSYPVSVPAVANQAPPVRTTAVNKPARAKYIASGDILLVNSGSSQVMRVNKGGFVGVDKFQQGYIRWMFDKFCDPKRLLRPGQPLQLQGPTDALLWQETEPNGTTVTVHCVVADSGNHRVLDLAYQFTSGALSSLSEQDPASGFFMPYVNWVSRTESMNQRYIFDSIQLVGGDQIWAAISNYSTGTSPLGSPSPVGKTGLGGAIVALEYRDKANPTGPWNYSTPKSGQVVARCDSADWSGTIRPLAGPRFFQITDKPDGRHMLICDNYGVYEVILDSSGVVVGPALVDDPSLSSYPSYRSLPREIVSGSTGAVVANIPIGAPLVATSAQELFNGHWLISNTFSGEIGVGGRKFRGEVFQYDPAAREIVWSAPLFVSSDGVLPWEQKLKNSSPPEQPRSALRQY